MSKRIQALAAVSVVGTLGLSGCVSNYEAGATLTVDITDTTCAVSAATATSGNVKFEVTNNGTEVNEFEILADDKLRIVGEKENITPGQTISYIAQLQPGSYYTVCKPGMVGAGVGLTSFSVTGDEIKIADDELSKAAITNYIGYVRSQVGELLPLTKDFANAFIQGNVAEAKKLFPLARVHYERIEPTAEQLGDLDPKIDYRRPGALEELDDFTGFHRLEMDLWLSEAQKNYPDEGITALSAADRKKYGELLISDVQTLYDFVYSDDFKVTLADIPNGAVGLLDEVASPDGKLPGEEDEFSHTDLYDFYANVEGSEVAYGYVREIALNKGDDGKALVASLDKEFGAMKKMLETYGNYESGFVDYSTVDQSKRNELGAQLNALSEPLAELTGTVLGLAQ